MRTAAGEGSMTVQRMCALLELSRAGFYRKPGEGAEKRDHGPREALQKIAAQTRRYGYRRMTKELQHRGWKVNHKRVLGLMRQEKLLCWRRKSWIRTTDSEHGLAIYPNLARDLKVSGLNQLWVADITYIPLQIGFAYLAVILDAYSRRVVGWAVDETLEAKLTLAALRMALRRRGAPAGLVHHSDQGKQFACRPYVKLLRAHGIRSSMSRAGNPYDNALMESFFKTLKLEEVCGCEYQNAAQARRRMRAYIENIYNRQRLHSALDYVSPSEFETQLQAAASTGQTSGAPE
jgi:putative transposase